MNCENENIYMTRGRKEDEKSKAAAIRRSKKGSCKKDMRN